MTFNLNLSGITPYDFSTGESPGGGNGGGTSMDIDLLSMLYQKQRFSF